VWLHSGVRKTWKKRWFVLTDTTLSYYEGTDTNFMKTLKGSIDMSRATSVRNSTCPTQSSENFELEIETPNRTYRLVVATKYERDQWVKDLTAAVKNESGSSSVASKPKQENIDPIEWYKGNYGA
jgi:hypothetical protein